MVVALMVVGGLATFTGWKGYVLSTEIQADRRANCRDANRRHDETVRVLDGLIARVPASQRAQARSSREYTVALIDALAPKRQCS